MQPGVAQWTIVVPMSVVATAKTRLIPATADDAAHRTLVRAMRRDVLAAVLATPGVGHVVIVTADSRPELPGDDRVHVCGDPGGGLNAAVRAGVAYAGARWPAAGVAVLVSDLPALTPAALGEALARAAEHRCATVADADGTGTTMLSATPGSVLSPAFGSGSAARHRSAGAVPITAAAGLRTDVDTAADLAAAQRLGVGPATAAAIHPAPGAADGR